jgi:hypothetical protein
VTQLGLLDDVTRTERPRKRQRQTARTVYAVRRAQDEAKRQAGKETREAMVLRCLAGYWNRYQVSPTALELLQWMQGRGERVFDVNGVRPRLTYLCADGLVEAGAKRICAVSGKRVHVWRVRSR